MGIPYNQKPIILNFDPSVKTEEALNILSPLVSRNPSGFIDRGIATIENDGSYEYITHGCILLVELGMAIIRPEVGPLNRLIDPSTDQSMDSIMRLLSAIDGIKSVARSESVELCNSWSDSNDHTWGLQATKADKSKFDGSGIKIGVLDSGIDFQDAEIMSDVQEARNFLFTPECRPEIPQVQARNDFRWRDVWDEADHGTHVAATIALSRSGDKRRYSIAPGAKIYVAKAVDNTDTIYRGMNWLVGKKVDIINMSFRVDTRSILPSTIKQFDEVGLALLEKNILPIAAVGNDSIRSATEVLPDGRRVPKPYIAPIGYPAASPYYLAVGAIDQDEAISDYSNGYDKNFGSKVNIVGPGNDVLAAAVCDQVLPKSGTSMACPHVAGVAALWAEKKGKYRGKKLWKKLIKEARGLGGGDFGSGIVQAP